MINLAERIGAIYAAFGRGDLAYIYGAVREDADWAGVGPELARILPWLQNARGPRAYFAGVIESMDISSFVPRAIFVNGHDVVAIIDLAYTAKRTGKKVTTTECHHFTLDDDGRVVRYRPFLDEAAFAAAFTPS